MSDDIKHGLAKTHLAAAKDAAVELDQFLAAYGHRVRVYGKPPTISLQLSLMAAHHLLEAVDILQKLAADEPTVDSNDDFYPGPVCGCCNAYTGVELSVTDHDQRCEWRRAWELMGELQSDG